GPAAAVGAARAIPWQYLMVDGKLDLSRVLHQPVRTGAGRQVATVFFTPRDSDRRRREAVAGFERAGIFPSLPYTVAMPRDEETGGFSLWVRVGLDTAGGQEHRRIALDARGWAQVLLAVKAESPQLGEAANVVALTCATGEEQLEELRPQLARAGLRALLHAPASRAAARPDGFQLEGGGSLRAISAEGEVADSRVRYPRSAYVGPFDAGPGIVFHGSDSENDSENGDMVVSSASRAGRAVAGPGEGAGLPGPVSGVAGLEAPPAGFDAVLRWAWGLLVAGVGSAAGLRERSGAAGVVLEEGQVREVVAEFARRVAGLAGDGGQRVVLEAAVERYAEVGGTSPGFDLGVEVLFRRWAEGRLRAAGGAGQRVGQALGLLGHRPLTPDERAQAVVKVVTVDSKGNSKEKALEESHQKVLDHLLDEGAATVRDIASAVLGVDWSASDKVKQSASDKVRFSLNKRLAEFRLAGTAGAQGGYNSALYTAFVPPAGGRVLSGGRAERSAFQAKALAYLAARPNERHTVADIAGERKHIERDSIGAALEGLVRTGAVSKRIGEDGRAWYQFVPEGLRPEPKRAGAGDVPPQVVAFLERAEGLGKPFTVAEISKGTGLAPSSVGTALLNLEQVQTAKNEDGANTYWSSAVGQVRVLSVGSGRKRRAGGSGGAEGVGGRKRRGAVPGGVRGGVGRVVSGLMDPGAAVSEGRARVLAELAGDFAVAVANGGTGAVLRVRGYFGPGAGGGAGAYEASVTAALMRGLRE
ncbi:hypothetical protein ACFXPA_48955, partial [Amycolatopsis sp. NPDC059090]|uniref:hypothetical protein n=1 Tax=Amycolatopsis sp. NPDC059090 TaxID=3346723 RepID=UPI0036726A3A